MKTFARAHLDNLKRFSQIAWGNPQALLRQLPGASPSIEFLDLGEYFESFQKLFNGLLNRPGKILVRNEYHAAVKALQTDPVYKTGAYVTGQPGIGKTAFLFYALVHFLGQSQPVALHHLGGEPFYVLFKKTATIHRLTNDKALSECSFVWALSDSNADVQYPPAIFRAIPDRIRVIQTTSPNASRWKEWSKQSNTSGYVMDIWTKKEIAKLAKLLELDVERMVTLARRWGPIPRSLLMYLNQQDSYIEAFYCSCAATAIRECGSIMNGGHTLNMSTPSPFYFIRPMKLDTGDLYRGLSDMFIPTRKLRKVLAEGTQDQDNIIKLQFYRVLSQSADTRQAAGFIFKSWFRDFIATGNQVPCQWVSRGPDDYITQLPALLPETAVLAPATWSPPSTQTPPYYWHAPHANFLGIDGILVLEKDIFAFQMTLSADYMSPIDGLREMRKSLPADLKNLPWRVVFVGTEGERIAQVAQHWASVCFLGRTPVRVGWSALDAVEDVPHRADHGETDSLSEKSGEEMMEVEEQ